MSKISEKLKYLNETKGLIREAIEEQGGIIEDTTTFREYADVIKNIPGNIGELETWEKIELPVEFVSPTYFGPDSEHIFVSETSYTTTDRDSNGLWLYNDTTKTWTQLYDKYGGYRCMAQADDGSYIFYPYAYSTEITFDLISYNLQTNEFKIIGENAQVNGISYADEFQHGMTFSIWGEHLTVWNKHLNQMTINTSLSVSKGIYTFGDYIIFDLGTDTMKIGNINTGVIQTMSSNTMIGNSSNLTLVTLTNNVGLLSYGYSTSTTDYLGLYLINGESQTLTKIYDAGYDWEHMEEFANCYLVTSTGSFGILKINKENYQVTPITTTGSAYTYNTDVTKMNEGVVRLNDTTAICTAAEDKRTIALLDVDTLEWNVLYSYTGTSSVTRRILRGNDMVLVVGSSATTIYVIHNNSTVQVPNFIKSSVSISPNRTYRTDWGYAVNSSLGSTYSQVYAYYIEGNEIKEREFSRLFYVRTLFESYNGAYYYNNNNDDPDDAYIVYIDRKDYSKCYDFKFAHTYTYYVTDMWQGANDKIYIMGTSGVLGIYDEKTREIKYYGDLGEHYDDYHSDSSLPRWQDFDMIQAGPNHNYNWCTRGIIFCDEEKMQPQYTFNVGNVWRSYTYNDYYIEDIFSRRMFKIIPDKCNFINYWLYDGTYDWTEHWFNFKAGISNKYILICKDGEE